VALRVLVDATGVPADRGALGRYVDGLIGALGATGTDLAVACQLADEERYRRHAPDATIVAGPVGLGHRTERLAWEQSGLPVLAERVGADVLHMPYYSMPTRPGLPTVVTIHDVTFFTDPERYTASHAMSLKSATKAAARQATRLIVPSNATRDELVRVLGMDPARIDVAYHGVDHTLFHRPTPEQVTHVTARLGLRGKPYIAFLGSLTPRKNAPAVVQGWSEAVADLENPPALVLAGGGGWSVELDEAVSAVPPNLRLVRPGYLPFADLAGGRERGGVHRAGRGVDRGRAAGAARRPGAASRPWRGRTRPGQGVHLGGVGHRARGELQAGGRIPIVGCPGRIGPRPGVT
jgi:glycosyltransferase involved in cell wall biosynthesis